jgi:hypothetical protein
MEEFTSLHRLVRFVRSGALLMNAKQAGEDLKMTNARGCLLDVVRA